MSEFPEAITAAIGAFADSVEKQSDAPSVDLAQQMLARASELRAAIDAALANAAEEEREACAKVCEAQGKAMSSMSSILPRAMVAAAHREIAIFETCADLIRARSRAPRDGGAR